MVIVLASPELAIPWSSTLGQARAEGQDDQLRSLEHIPPAPPHFAMDVDDTRTKRRTRMDACARSTTRGAADEACNNGGPAAQGERRSPAAAAAQANFRERAKRLRFRLEQSDGLLLLRALPAGQRVLRPHSVQQQKAKQSEE